jgi:hypothetical protein
MISFVDNFIFKLENEPIMEIEPIEKERFLSMLNRFDNSQLEEEGKIQIWNASVYKSDKAYDMLKLVIKELKKRNCDDAVKMVLSNF